MAISTTTPGQPEEWYLNCLLEFSALRPPIDSTENSIFFAVGFGECSTSRLPSMEPVDSTPTGEAARDCEGRRDCKSWRTRLARRGPDAPE